MTAAALRAEIRQLSNDLNDALDLRDANWATAEQLRATLPPAAAQNLAAVTATTVAMITTAQAGVEEAAATVLEAQRVVSRNNLTIQQIEDTLAQAKKDYVQAGGSVERL